MGQQSGQNSRNEQKRPASASSGRQQSNESAGSGPDSSSGDRKSGQANQGDSSTAEGRGHSGDQDGAKRQSGGLKGQLSGQNSQDEQDRPEDPTTGQQQSKPGSGSRQDAASGDQQSEDSSQRDGSSSKGRVNPSDLDGAKPNASDKYNAAYSAVMCDYRDGKLRGQSSEIVKDRNEAKSLASAAADKTGQDDQQRTVR